MKKIKVFLLLVFIPLIMVGCGQVGGGGGGTSDSIIGKWNVIIPASRIDESYTFNTGGTYDWKSNTSQSTGTWSIDGDKLTLDTTKFKLVTSGNSMYWYDQNPATGEWDTLGKEFTKG